MGHIEFNTSDIKLCLGAAEVSAAYLGDEKVYPAEAAPNYLAFENLGNNSVSLSLNRSNDNANWPSYDIEFSYDLKLWYTLTPEASSSLDRYIYDENNNVVFKCSLNVIPISDINTHPAFRKVYIRGNNTAINTSSNDYVYFNLVHFENDKHVVASGNIMSLLSKTGFEQLTTVPDYCFYALFINCDALTTAPELPATTVGQYAYSDMFNGCTSLTTAPALPATTLNTECYSYMFTDCSSLTAPPTTLPATTLANACYRSMFKNCVIMTLTPTLPALTMTQDCYREMFYGCDYMVTAPALPATTVATRCYYSMFEHCDSLATPPPVLPALTLASSCYCNMFKQCGFMTTAPIIQATTCAQSCCYKMFYYCTRLSQAPALPATTLANNCYYQMFYRCNSLTQAPVLPALTLVTDCYKNMFYLCSNLSYVKAMFTTTPGYMYTVSWLYGVAAGGTFVKNAAATWTDVGYNAVPSGWTIETASS